MQGQETKGFLTCCILWAGAFHCIMHFSNTSTHILLFRLQLPLLWAPSYWPTDLPSFLPMQGHESEQFLICWMHWGGCVPLHNANWLITIQCLSSLRFDFSLRRYPEILIVDNPRTLDSKVATWLWGISNGVRWLNLSKVKKTMLLCFFVNLWPYLYTWWGYIYNVYHTCQLTQCLAPYLEPPFA